MKRVGTLPRRGATLIELLLALSIVAALLAATAAAVHAAFRAYQVNQEQSSLIQRARIAMDRLTTVIRTTKDHSPDNPGAASQFTAGRIVTDTGIALFDINNVETRFRYDALTHRILAIVGGKTYVLLNGVDLFQVTFEPMRSAESLRTGGPYDLLQRATILITVRTNSDTNAPSETTNTMTLSLSASAMPRRNTW
jgi:prepilin-type N-terminal cleavage/methylation domain-containing protein